MEEQVDKNENQNDDKLRNEVEDKAKQSKNIDTQTAAVNENNQIIDIEDVLAKNDKLAYKVNNLLKLNIGMERIKELVSIKSKFSVGDAEKDLEDEIEWVADRLIVTISENENGIVLNADGTINEEKSEAQQERVEAIYDVYSQSYVLSKETVDDVFDKVFSYAEISFIDEKNISFSFEYVHDVNITPEDIKNLFGSELTNENAEKVAAMYNDTNFTSEASAILSARLFDFEKEYEKLVNEGIPEKEIESILSGKLQEIKDEISERNQVEVTLYGEERKSGLLEQIKDLDVKDVIKFHRDFKEKRELSDIVLCLGGKKDDQIKRIKKLVLGYKYKDDRDIQALLTKEMKEQGFGEYSIENLIKLINENNILPHIQSEDEFYEFVDKVGYTKEKAEEYANSVKHGDDRDGKEAVNKYESGIYSEFEYKIGRIYLKPDNKIDRKSTVMEILALYKEQSNITEETNVSNRFKELLSIFIMENKNVFEFYTREYGGILYNGLIDMDKIDQILIKEGTTINPDNKKRLESAVIGIEDAIIRNTPQINELKKILSGEIRDAEIEQMVSLINSIENKALGGKLLSELRALKNEKIDEAIENGKVAVNEKGKKVGEVIFDVDEKDKKEFVIEENMLLIESKLRLAKGTSMYNSVLEEKNRIFKSFHKTSKEYETIVQSAEFEKRLKSFEETLLNESLKSSIQKKDIKDIKTADEKKNYSKFILIALDEGNAELYGIARKQIVEMYPEFDKEYDNEKIKAGLCEKIYGKKLSQNEIDKRVSNIKKNLLSILIRSKEIESTKGISDVAISELMANRGEELDVSGIDLVKSDLQNLFTGSSVTFTDKDENLFKELYTDAVDKSIITSKREAYLQLFISLNLSKERINKNTHGIYNKEKVIPSQDKEILRILEEYPEFEKIIGSNGKIDKNYLERNKDFRIGTVHVEILSNLKSALTDKNMSVNRKIQLGVAAYAIARSEESEDSKIKDLFNKFAIRIFEEVGTEDKPAVDKNGKFIEENLLDYYNQVNNIKMTNVKDMVDFVNERECVVKTASIAKRYTSLDEKDYLEINEQSDAEEKRIKAYEVIGKRQEENAREKIAQDRMKLIEKDVRILYKKDVDEINDPFIAAIFYKIQIDEKRKKNPNFDTTAMEEDFKKEYPNAAKEGIFGTYDYIKRRVTPYDFKNVKNLNYTTSIDIIIGGEKVQSVLKNAKDRLEERKEMYFDRLKNDIGGIDPKYIEKKDDPKINSIWYYQNISKYYSMGCTEKAQKLKDEFEQKFPGIDMEENVNEMKERIDSQVEKSFLEGEIPKIKNIHRKVIGEENYIFMDTFRIICKKNNNLQKAKANKVLKEFFKSDSSEDNIGKIASLYNTSFENKYYKGTEFVKNFIEKDKEKFKDFFDENGNFDATKVIEMGKERSTDVFSLYNSMKKEITKAEKHGIRDKENANQVYEYLTSTKEYSNEEKGKIEEAITNMIDKNNVSKDLRTAFEQRDKGMLESAQKEVAIGKKDTWKHISATILTKGIRAITYLPKILSREVSISEYSSKIFRNTKKIQRRISKKVIGGKNNRYKELFEPTEKKALPEGKNSKNLKPSDYETDKANSNQHTHKENNGFYRTDETVGCDIGVAQNMKSSRGAENINIQDEIRGDK